MESSSHCLLCHQQGRLLFQTKEGKIIEQCDVCGLVWTKNFVGQDMAYYQRDEVYETNQKMFKNFFAKLLKVLRPFVSQKGKMYEVGSSVGNLLSVFKKEGWEVLGIEPSKKAAKRAMKKGYQVMNQTIEEAKIDQETYDLVVFNHTLEHLENPLEVLKKVNKTLKKGGLILITAPNFASLSCQIQGQSWPYLLPKEHRWHFSPQSLTKMLKEANFSVTHSQTISGIFNCAEPLAEIRDSLLGLKKRFFTNLLFLPGAFLATKLNRGTNLVVIGRRV